MAMKRTIPIALTFLLIAANCDSVTNSDSSDNIELGSTDDLSIPDWSTNTHSNDVDPNYEIVFEENSIKELHIEISETNWSAMQSDLDENMPSGNVPGADVDFDPVWVPATVTFEGKDWYKVGIRYKGNSTLRNAYQSGTVKYPFKLDFDEFEDDFPQIENQRFYGFKQLNLSNNDSDESFMREKIAADLFRDFGIPSARTAFYAVYLDRGDGSQFIGLYTLVEEVDDSVPDSQFSDDNGNLYKPDGDAASFASGSYDEDEFELKTNEDEANFSDVKALYDLLHDEQRTTDPEQWKSDLEAIFDVDGFLKYLAVNNTIQNWDTYGIMTHNYFLYNNEGRLTWIPWDNNESFQDGKQGGALSFSMNEVSSSWPLISYLISIDEYETNYTNYVDEFATAVFDSDEMSTLLNSYKTLLESYATQENSGFSSDVNSLISYIASRNSAAKNFAN